MNREDCGSKEEVGGLIPGCEISSRLDRILVHVVDCLMYFGVGMSAFCLQKKEKNKRLLFQFSSWLWPQRTSNYTPILKLEMTIFIVHVY